MKRKPKVLVSRRFVGEAVQRMKELYDVREWTEEGPMPAETLAEWIADCDAYYGPGDPLDRKLIEAAPRLKVISQVAVGVDNIDIAACTERGIVVCNTPHVLTDATADMTIALLLAWARRLPEQIDFVREGKWRMNSPTQLLGRDIRGKVLGIVGLGEIGEAVARRAAAFGMRIVYYNREPRTDIPVDLAEFRPLEALLGEADFVSLHVPLTETTRRMIDAEKLRRMKPTAVLINMARGGVVHTEDLYRALIAGEIAGAALDVTDPEPLPADHPLLRLPNVIVTPHAGSATYETRDAMAMLALDNLQAALAGRRPKHCVNPEVFQRERG
jgi:glyoxylate reductase